VVDKKGHIIFDFDGTVVSNFDALKKLISTPVLDMEKAAKKTFGFKLSTWIKNLGSLTTHFHHHYEAYEGIPELLQELQNRGHSLYIWTLRDPVSTEIILESVGLRHFFKAIKGTEEDHIKPGIQGLLNMVGEHRPENVIIIGDGWTDIIGSKFFGCPSIFAMWGKKFDLFFKKGRFSYTARYPKQCLEFIDDYFHNRTLKKGA
jgi:phosphoglycolate phosphatase-like HAD superfamily hydrolase